MPSIDAHFALSLAVRLAAIAFTMGAAEQLVVRQQAFGPRGPFSETIARVYGRGVSGTVTLDRVFQAALVTNVAAGSVLVLLGPAPIFGPLALAMCLAGNVVVRRRRVTASDGAEQMAMLIMVAAFLATVPIGDGRTVEVAVYFISAQAVLAYSAAGLAKAVSPVWRGGNAVPLIIGSEAHGHSGLSSFLTRFPAAGRALTILVVVFECTFWLAVVGPWQVTLAIFLAGLAFHLGCALTMGLNSFLWAFPATYACVLYTAQQISHWQ
jgi:hypothetical protein